MYRGQVYNTVAREPSQTSDHHRRLNHRIHHNMGLINSSRSSNNSSFRLRRTELSIQRFNSSRDKGQISNQNSGLNSVQINDNRGYLPKKIGSNVKSSSRRNNYQCTSPNNMQRASGKNIVENLYMLTNNQHRQQLGDKRERVVRQQDNEQQQSPRPNYRQQFNHIVQRVEQDYTRNVQSRSNSRGSRGSRLIQRISKNGNSKILDRSGLNREKNAYNNKNRQFDPAYKKLEEKYLANIYELQSPSREAGRQRNDKGIERAVYNQNADHYRNANNKYYRRPIQGSYNSSNQNFPNQSSSKNINEQYFQGQQTTTSGGTGVIKTLPENSKVQTLSLTSLPVNSITSQKDLPRATPKIYHKNSVKLDRPKQKLSRKLVKQKVKEKQKEKEEEMSSLSARWKMNNIQFQERKDEEKRPNRNQKIIDGDDEMPSGSIFLPVESRQEEGRQLIEDILQRIILHLQSLNIIAEYTKEFRKMYQNVQPWQILIFLTYKKFYIERIKVTEIIKEKSNKKVEESDFFCKQENPFILPYSKIGEEELVKFRGSRQCMALRYELQTENTKIRNALRGLYNLYIQKSGEHVNMLDCDNFSEEIYRLMLEELDGISQNLEQSSLVEPTKIRMGRIIKCGMLIAYLNGKYVKNFAQVLLHQDIVKVGRRQTLREDSCVSVFLQEFKKVLAS